MKPITDLSFQEIEELMQSLGAPKFRAKQVYEGIMLSKSLNDINIDKPLKDALALDYDFSPIKISVVKTGKDGTQKFLYELSDGGLIEGVLMKYKYGYTLCVSTQVGCRMGCKFCASTQNGLIRNLSAGEILGQVLVVNKMLGATLQTRKITNVVLMGSGEPLDNYDNVVKFLRLVSSPEGINISPRNISLSTCGIAPKIKDLADLGIDVTLTISLHNADDEKRKRIMPIANSYSLKEIIDATKYYFDKTKRRIIFEYALIKDENDSQQDVQNLKNLLAHLPCHINIIPLNEVDGSSLKTPGKKSAYQFCEKLEKEKLSATVRRTMGEDIDGACGQLRAKHINNV